MPIGSDPGILCSVPLICDLGLNEVGSFSDSDLDTQLPNLSKPIVGFMIPLGTHSEVSYVTVVIDRLAALTAGVIY